jgi:hypothetical protein
MEQALTERSYDTHSSNVEHNEAHSSGVSWAAVIAGAFVTAALSLILLALGAGLGLSSVSPYSNSGASASTIGKSTIIWLIVMEILSASMGGYLAGRLRTKWASIHTDEVYFRDTAHGFLSWATALVITAAFLASAASVMIGSAPALDGQAKSGSSTQANNASSDPNAYFVGSLFRSDAPKAEAASDSVRTEAAIIFANGLRQGELPSSDKSYLDQLVSSQAGLDPSQADKRVSNIFATAQQRTEETRRAIAHTLLWTFLALLIGAFCASFSATIGGKQRDHVVII